jgi:hypothetical protein
VHQEHALSFFNIIFRLAIQSAKLVPFSLF